jgi:hypothetical protein
MFEIITMDKPKSPKSKKRATRPAFNPDINFNLASASKEDVIVSA